MVGKVTVWLVVAWTAAFIGFEVSAGARLSAAGLVADTIIWGLVAIVIALCGLLLKPDRG